MNKGTRIAKFLFSSQNTQKQTEFKSFFRLRLKDNPIRLYRRLRETTKRNPQVKRMLKLS